MEREQEEKEEQEKKEKKEAREGHEEQEAVGGDGEDALASVFAEEDEKEDAKEEGRAKAETEADSSRAAGSTAGAVAAVARDNAANESVRRRSNESVRRRSMIASMEIEKEAEVHQQVELYCCWHHLFESRSAHVTSLVCHLSLVLLGTARFAPHATCISYAPRTPLSNCF